MKRFLGIIALTVFASSSQVAHAGARNVSSVIVSNSTASGSLGSARNQGGTYPYGGQYIGCYTMFEGSSNTFGVCTAQDAAGYYLACTTTNAELIRAMRTVTSDSFIFFRADAGGYCSRVYIHNYSYYEPKAP